MARIVIHFEQGPMEICCGGVTRWLCRCGLSQTQPWCDGSHVQTCDEAPGTVYAYDNGCRTEVAAGAEDR